MERVFPSYYTVSAVTARIKDLLVSQFPSVGIEGEISNFRPSGAGHWYFTLKDEEAAISVVMFRHRNMFVTFTPADGMQVRVLGSISVYEKRGAYQVICDAMEESGEGEILARLERLKRTLADEGLFQAERKRPLPRFPRIVGVITSPTGAALRDILNVLKRRHAGIRVIVYPAAVQGDDSPRELIRALDNANHAAQADVLIIGRGGGSLEDLLPFSDEQVVRRVAASSIPVISAVGHEIDWALTDYAADMRAPTPSAAAEMVSEASVEVLERIASLTRSMADTLEARLDRLRLVYERFSPGQLGELFSRLLQPRRLAADDLREELLRSMRERLTSQRHAVTIASRELTAHSPQAVLDRGFSVVTRAATGEVLTSSVRCIRGEEVHIQFSRGSALADIKETHP